MIGGEFGESGRACALVVALNEHEITSEEFVDAVKPLSAEEMQVIATILQDYVEQSDGCIVSSLRSARRICLQLATTLRQASLN
jgi:hypothetical protein